MKTILRQVNLVALFACVASAAPATPSQSFTGSFSTDADSPAFSFTISQSAPVTLRTYSYAGGTNAAGATIPGGGFDPTISLYDSLGNLIIGNRDGGCGNVAADSVTSFCWDSYLNVPLPAGTYSVVVTQSENLPNGPTLASSFVYAGQGTFTTPPTPAGLASPGFWDLFPGKRTGAYALDIISTALVVPPPAITPVPTLTFTSSGALGGFTPDATISGTFAATGGVGPYTFSSIGLPPGLSLNTATGAYSGTGGNPGFYSFSVVVTDAEAPAQTATLNVTYSVLGIITTALPQGSTTAPYSATVTATGGLGAYSFTASGLPSGLSISTGGAITGTPQNSGTFAVTVKVTSGGLSTSAALVLTVTPPVTQPLTVTSATLPPGTVSAPYPAAGLQATGGTPPYSWSVVGGVLPTGMSLSGNGSVTGTASLAATYGFTAKVTDSTGATATGTFTLVISPAPLTLSLGTFPTGVVNSSYPLQILTPLAAGGQAPYTFAVTTGNLPAGLTLSGQEVSGTPTTAGTFTFTVTVTDASGKSVTGNGSIVIIPAQPTLILSQSTVSFNLTAGAAGVPTPAQVTIRSSSVSTLLNYSFSVSPAVSWLDVNGGTGTPGSLTLAIDPTAPSLAASATPYSTAISVSCLSTQCAGLTQTILVSLLVTAPPAQLTLNSSLLSFSAFSANPVVSSQTLGLQNSGGGTINIGSITSGAPWLTVTGVPSTLTAGPGTSVLVTANPTGLSAGYYTTTLTVNSSAGIVSIPVTLLVTQALTMNVNPGGSQYSVPAGGSPGNSSGSFNVSASGTGTLSWSASLSPGANWVALNTASGTSTAASAGSVSYTLNSNIIAALAPATYFATITLSAPGVSDTQQQFQIVLTVTPASTPVNPVLSSAGLIFTSGPAGTTAAQSVLVYSSQNVATPYQASAVTTDGASWLAVSPATGSATAVSAAQSSVAVNVSGLAPGVYSGGVSYAFSSEGVRTVNVTLLVFQPNGGPASRSGPTTEVSAGSCSPTKLIGTQTGLYNNFAQAAGWPTPLSVNLINDCGVPVNGASLTTTFSNGDPPLALSPRDSASGVYVGTWTPRNPSSQVTVTATAMHSPFATAASQVTGEVRTNAAPILTPNGTLDVFNPVVGAALSPGQVIQIYGSNLATQTAIAPLPLPTTLAGTQVLIGGVPAPLYYVSSGQIDAQIPIELTPGTQYQILVSVSGSLSTPAPIQIVTVAPNIANQNGQVLAEHLDGSLITATAPAQPGEFVVLFLSGLGATSNPVPDGAVTPSPSNASLLSVPLVTPTLNLNGTTVPTVFVGLTPTAVGLYQIDFQMPASIPAGTLPLFVTQNGANSNTVFMPVQ